MSDYLVKSLAFDGQIRAYAVDATETVSTAQKLHDTWSAASAALGRSLVGTLLLASASLQGDVTMTVKINGNGPVGGIVVDGNANGTVKGYVQNPHVHLPLNDKHKIDVKGAVGTEGFLAVTKDLGLKEPFTGQVPLVSGELGEDFTYYLAKSEQIPSSVGLSVFVNSDNSIETAGGFMIQVMPGAKEETISQIEKRLAEIPMVSEMMRDGKKPEDILNEILGAENVKVLDKMPVSYHCDCSRERFLGVLTSLPTDQLQEMADEDHGAEAVCHFCGKKYQFTEDELRKIIKVKKQNGKKED
ncbi:molecular chaperone Hsp33 [Ligilactobacillus aviarius]|uniref:Hsp33 family molecular chaperone HslO n=1 Tax=Ligilactobacillus aviarius TaxID=1606 RepID=UPI0007D9AD6B|nr:Hsp33 family molecular chaperone HslO [Ligilactobacillus aviarius]OAQ02050.1 molecular chaperone Hsp33 [Ligilactobacillus aviarius]OAQ04944.1 molecular chaperone Hsp33 [Ligilactobacillus aviarius]OAS80171.1 molecular chaperone Hsp33 [Ligilactobacillus aviarius]PEG70242.1 Hsp33 family molecular chaperone HslO [Ligilactobacillus aviarius]PEG73518.1 Hsp33 family molecular chaperone HslO [Ligilactobacillus aviarius]